MTRGQAALHLLGVLDTLTQAQQKNLTVRPPGDNLDTPDKVYIWDDFSVVNRFESMNLFLVFYFTKITVSLFKIKFNTFSYLSTVSKILCINCQDFFQISKRLEKFIVEAIYNIFLLFFFNFVTNKLRNHINT